MEDQPQVLVTVDRLQVTGDRRGEGCLVGRVAAGGQRVGLKVLATAGLIVPAGTRQVRGGTERYYRRAAARLSYSGPDAAHAIATAFQAIAEEVTAAAPDPFLVLRHLRLTPQRAAQVTAALRELAGTTEDAGPHDPRYGLLLGLYQPHHDDPAPTDRG